MKRTLPILILCIFCSSAAFASFNFWGITLDKDSHLDSAENLTFSGLEASGVQYVVGGYKYSKVDSTWSGPFEAASPGADFSASLRCDAQGLFFKSTATSANFFIIAGSNQDGNGMSEVGFKNRQFGPGDLKIDIGGNTYGIGMRKDNLLWAVEPDTTEKEFKIYKTDGETNSIYARNAGTLGTVEKNPEWSRVGQADMPAFDEKSYAFFVKNSGTTIGSATINFEATGIRLSNEMVYGYEVSVPWSVLGQTSTTYNFDASWRSDCGNDIIKGSFETPSNAVPEPSSLLALSTVLVSVYGLMRRKGQK